MHEKIKIRFELVLQAQRSDENDRKNEYFFVKKIVFQIFDF